MKEFRHWPCIDYLFVPPDYSDTGRENQPPDVEKVSQNGGGLEKDSNNNDGNESSSSNGSKGALRSVNPTGKIQKGAAMRHKKNKHKNKHRYVAQING